MTLTTNVSGGSAALAPTGPAPSEPAIQLTRVSKHFGRTRALVEVTLDIAEREVHAIVGENGAGKSTLIRILTAAFQPTAGSVEILGRQITDFRPGTALDLGVYAVHQEMLLCPHLTVTENLFLGQEATCMGRLCKREMRARAVETLRDFGVEIDPGAVLSTLSIGRQQLVGVARSILFDSRVVIFDEPTAYLTRHDTDLLFRYIRRLKAEGRTVIYISHRMEEIFELCDRASVLRDGQLVSTFETAATSPEALIECMANRAVGDVHHKELVTLGPKVLAVEGLSGEGFEDVTFDVRAGEIVGFFGLIGSGRSELMRGIFGRTRSRAGQVYVEDRACVIRREADAIGAGIVLIPESRRDEGLCLSLGIRPNLSLPSLPSLAPGGIVNGGEERQSTRGWMQKLGIVASSVEVEVGRLSGGNQQKVVIGKWLQRGAKLYIFDEPTVGVDVRTKSEIYRIIAGLLKEGAAVIIVSSYLPEVFDLADRLHVMRTGRVVQSFDRGQASQAAVLSAAIG
ncbi:sugar ABC transporter ATP-binding protein [Puniceibacterium sp. IMCC21224]|uniref:sugar ABC transporter ATP-binding protein n=1 Tax=Puniceibacterium sp. IMCC21224 TaxID=1618204 RepID=UPI00064DA12C|nr:sugar ABC transporter ATP-binding protein [Puniceibacterium sp. IMCC21224]KMK64495.1 ABC-type sugar transport system, ATPase component [Puniceibacterium sp. IMCC21224]